MKTLMRKTMIFESMSKSVRNILGLSLIYLIGISGAHAATVSFSPLSETVTVGENFSMDIIGNFSGTFDGGGLNLSFASSVVNVTSVTVNTVLFEFFPSPGTINNSAGTISNIIFNTFTNTPAGIFTIATVDFTALGVGISPLTLTESALNPFALAGNPVAVTFESGSISATAVPLPPAVWLFISGMGLLFGARGESRACVSKIQHHGDGSVGRIG